MFGASQASGDTALHLAVMAGSTGAVRTLVELGLDKDLVNKAGTGCLCMVSAR